MGAPLPSVAIAAIMRAARCRSGKRMVGVVEGVEILVGGGG